MLCTKCGKNEATIYFSQNINGNKTEYNLCSECAKEMDISSYFEKHRQYIQNNFFAPVGSFGFPLQSFFETPVFSSPLFDFSLQGTALPQKEEASVPPPQEDNLTKLRRQLDMAVKEERYEDAAKYRDEIKALEK